MKRLLLLSAGLLTGVLLAIPKTAESQESSATQFDPRTPLSFELGASWMDAPDTFRGARLSGRVIYEINDLFYYAPAGTFGWIEQHRDFDTAQTFSAGVLGGLDPGRRGFWGLDFNIGLSALGVSDRDALVYFGPAMNTGAAIRFGYVNTIHVKFSGETTVLLVGDHAPFHYAGASLGFPW